MRSLFVAILLAGIALLPACGGSSSPGTSGTIVIGTVTGTQPSISLPARTSLFPKAIDFDNVPNCPDREHGGTASNTTPSFYAVKLKRITLLGSTAAGTADFDLLNAATIAVAPEVDSATSTTIASSSSYPPTGTYDGIEIEVYYIAMTGTLVVPAINAREGQGTFFSTSRTIRGYFQTVGNILPRDVTFFDEDLVDPTILNEYWINRKVDDPDLYNVVAVTGTHPDQIVDLWADDNFWLEDPADPSKGWRDPMTICTRATATCDPTLVGTDFTFAMTGSSTELVVPSSPSGLYTITFAFDVTDKFTFYEDLNVYPEQGTFRVGYDCGLRFLFPNVTISISNS